MRNLHKHSKIYQSRRHVVATIIIAALPFVFLLIFSRVSHLALGPLISDLINSFWRLVVAYAVAVALGWMLAVSFYRGRRANFFLPLFDVLQSFPTFAALPIAVLIFGASNITVIAALVITIIWPVLFSIISSLKLLKHEWFEAVEMSGLSGWPYITKFLWPASVPGLVTGSIIGLGEGWEALVATEIIVMIKPGLGDFFQSFSHNSAITAFGILGLLLFIFAINKIIWLPLLEKSHLMMED